ncbi:hypothetical protein Smp_186920 [Schistosoma mansoni]|uniref:Secreted protein n=1 Tax=Schistosoma mansoni TaxID=6183 RepID=G4VRA5_SCHMA|nr:hypothetical protein Smp_186920 [Schistosoma mansoni]|eukprot:XP_018655258.1 hypothetical protein Smp_186920 [Schistosoma mansoni]
MTPNTYDIHLVPNMVILVAFGSLAQSGFVLRLQRFWSGPLRTQPSDSGYKPLWCSMLIQTINTVRSFWYRSTSKTFGGNSRINDHFLFCQRLRPTIARFAISPTNETATYRKCKPFLAGGSCSDRPVSIRTRLE